MLSRHVCYNIIIVADVEPVSESSLIRIFTRKYLPTLGLNYVSGALGVLSQYVLLTFLVSHSTRELIGVYMTMSVIVTASGFFDFGLANSTQLAVVRSYAAGDWSKVNRVISASFSMGLVLGLIIFAVGLGIRPLLPRLLPKVATDSNEFQLLYLFMLMQAVCSVNYNVVKSVLVGLDSISLNNIINIGRIFLIAAVGFTVLKLDLGIAWFAFTEVAVTAVACILSVASVLFYFNQIRPRYPNFQNSEATMLLGSGSLFFLTQLNSGITFACDNIMITTILGPAAVVAYAVCFRLIAESIKGVMALVNVLYPRFAFLEVNGDHVESRNLTLFMTKISFAWATFIAIAYAMFCASFVHAWLGDGNYAGDLTIVVFGCFLIVICASFPLVNFFTVKNQVRTIAVLSCFSGLANIGLTYLLLPMWGVVGTAAASLGISLVNWFVLFSIAKRAFDWPRFRITSISNFRLAIPLLVIFLLAYAARVKLPDIIDEQSRTGVIAYLSIICLALFGAYCFMFYRFTLTPAERQIFRTRGSRASLAANEFEGSGYDQAV